MESQDSIGLLPAELMEIIIRMASMQVVSSIWMSNNYWHAKLKRLMEHPKIVFVTREGKSRNVFILNRGLGYHTCVSHRTPRIDNHATHPSLRVKSGWFNTVIELEEFLTEFKKIMKDNNELTEPESNVRPELFFLKIQHKETKDDDNRSTIYENKIHQSTYERLINLTNKAPIVNPIDPDAAAPFNGITLQVKNTTEYIWSNIYINTDGDVYMHSKTKPMEQSWRFHRYEYQFPISVQLRTSPKLFRQLEEVMVYRKHRKSLPELEDALTLCRLNTLFDVRYTVNGQNYFVQEYVLQSEKKNSYKNGSERKIVRFIESILFNESLPRLIYKEAGAVAPPTFAGHQLIRLPRCKMLVDEDLPSVIAIDLTLRNRTYTLHLNSNVPRNEIIQVFREAEQVIDPKDTEPCKVLIVVRQYFRVVRAIKVHSLKSFKPITKLPKPVVVKVWQLLVRSGDAPH